MLNSPPGGYYDAGDYIKATFPLVWALLFFYYLVLIQQQTVLHAHVHMLGRIGLRKRWINYLLLAPVLTCTGYDMANQTVYLDSMLRYGLDWLIKASNKCVR